MTIVLGLHGIATNNGNRVGSARVGKDEVARMLKELGYYHTFFAKPMYKVVNEVYGISTDNLTDYDKEEKIYDPWGMTLRQILQSIGDMFRCKDKDFFLKCALVDIVNNAETGQPVVISDVRFDNEADFVRDLGGNIVHIYRPVDVDNYKINPHSSEAGVAETRHDLHIFNSSTLKSLEQGVKALTLLVAEQMSLNIK